jgi:putative ABC transport system permease protein
MLNWMKLAFRNILRNKRRSFVTLLAIGVGFAAISLFRGYTDATYDALRQTAVRGEGLAHLTVAKQGWFEKGKLDPQRYMFTEDEVQRVIKLIKEEKDVVVATPQIMIAGLVSNGTVSTIFVAQGLVPKEDKIIKGIFSSYGPIKGAGLDEQKMYGVEMSRKLAEFLGLEAGKDGVAMAATLNGQMNAMDIQVIGVYETGTDMTNDKFMRVNYAFAQALYDAKMAEKVVVLLDDWRKTNSMRLLLLDKLTRAGFNCDIKTWSELSIFYSKVKAMFDSIFFFLFTIVMIIVVMSTVNTMGMTVLERTREIGTLRALGLKRRGVNLLFALEGGFLGLFGSLFGMILHVATWAVIRIFQPTYTPPGTSISVPLVVHLVPQVMVVLMGCLILLSLVAAVIPARRAAGQKVVDALWHV